MKGGAWLVLAVSMLMGLGLTIGAIASRRQMRTAVVVVLCLVGIGIVLAGAALSFIVAVTLMILAFLQFRAMKRQND